MNREQICVRCLGGLVLMLLPLQPAFAQRDSQASGTTEVSADYIIGAGDSLSIFVWRNPELSVQVPVRPDGKISCPLIDDMVATGKTASQLARDLESELSTYIRTPKVNVIVTTAAGASGQIRVVGEASSPRAIPFREGITVLDVLIETGGLGEFAAGNRAKIIRAGNAGKPTEIRVKLNSLIEKGDMSQNYKLKPGDVLVIPKSLF